MSFPTMTTTHQIVGTSFGFYTDEEILKLSVKKIEVFKALDRSMKAVQDGLYDPALGPTERDTKCQTCGLLEIHCPGHFGHIELPVPLFNPITFPQLYTILKMMCFNCHHFRMHRKHTQKFVTILRLINKGNIDEILEAVEDEDRFSLVEFVDTKESKKTKSKSNQKDKDKPEEKRPTFKPNFSGENPLRETLSKNIIEFRRKIVHKFIKSQPAKVCENCKAIKITVQKDGNAKIFHKRPIQAKMSEMWRSSIRYRSVLYDSIEDAENDPIVRWLFWLDHEKENEASLKPKKDRSFNEKIDLESLNQRPLFPNEVELHLKRLWSHEESVVSLIWSTLFLDQNGHKERRSDPLQFFTRVILVPPNRFRPLGMANGVATENPQNVYLSKLILLSTDIRNGTHTVTGSSSRPRPGQTNKTVSELRRDQWIEMQQTINDLVDSSQSMNSRKKKPPGVKQIIEKKQGLFRMNMMGKRVDYAARSVISPDPYIETNEIGVPLYFAKNLTYKETVTDYNVEWLRKLVINGPDVWPGANAVEDQEGNIVQLRKNKTQRIGIAKTLQTPSIKSVYDGGQLLVKRVYRHLKDGDFLIVNRQPTLHKPSMMVHKAKVLGLENTIQMHYANCNTYNADFDGDEMNLHLLQNELARSEASNIAINDNQYVVPKDGSPLRGLIQDHILCGVKLTNRDIFLTKDQIQQLIYFSCFNTKQNKPMITPPPAILKPVPLWTGKQIITAVLENLLSDEEPLNLTSACKIPEDMWGKGSMEGTIVIRNNQLLCGVLGKNQFGATSHGLVHSVYELYGPRMAGKLLTVLGRLFTHWLQFSGFTCGIDDALLNETAEKQRWEQVKNAESKKFTFSGLYTGIVENEEDIVTKSQRLMIKDKLKEIYHSKDDSFLWDKYMIGHASRYTSNIINICLPKGQVKKFPVNNLSMMTVSGAKGSLVNFSQISCLLGQQELEGKRVPVMVNGRTLPSFEPFDSSLRSGGHITGRFLTGIRPQEYYFHCMAGREGLIDTAVKTSRSGYLQRCIVKHLESLCVQYDHTVRDSSDGNVIQFNYGDDSIDVSKSKFLYKFDFFKDNCDALIKSYDFESATKKLKKVPKQFQKNLHKLVKKKMDSLNETLPDTLLNQYFPGSHMGSVSEQFEILLNQYIEKEKKANKNSKFHLNKLNMKIFKTAMYLKYIHSLAEPGEVVGILAAQSIGEPATQMTLNTFHLAGKGEVNVTLGIPRLRELIQTSGDNIKTPSMTLPIKNGFTKEEVEKFAKGINRLKISQILDEIVLKEMLVSKNNNHFRLYDTEIMFKNPESAFNMSWKKVKNKLKYFVTTLLNDIAKLYKTRRLYVGRDTSGVNYEDILQSGESMGQGEVMDEETVKASFKDKTGMDQDGTDAEEKMMRKKELFYEDEEREDQSMHVEDQNDEDDDDDNDEEEEEEKKVQKTTSRSDKIKTLKDLVEQSDILEDCQIDDKKMTLKLKIKVEADKQKLLLVSMIEQMSERFVLREVHGISRAAVIVDDKTNSIKMQTEGVNIPFAWRLHRIIDLDQLYVNDVQSVHQLYGIEAAREVLRQEISSVFKAYGINVDPRHLSLVSDYMTHSGQIQAMTRTGIANNSSPFLRMSFESTMKFLETTSMSGEYDNLKSPSASIVMGLPAKVGTGIFDILSDVMKSEKVKV